MRVLLVEDNPGDSNLVLERLQAVRGTPFRCQVVETLEEALGICQREPFDVVLLDMNLPDSNGLETVHAMRACSPAAPIVVLTGLDDHDTAVETLRRGADDYLAKSEVTPDSLRRTLLYAVERRRLRLSLETAVRSRDDLLRVVSHDLRNQLNAFAAALFLLDRELPADSPARQRVGLMERASTTMNRLLTDLLDLAALDTGALRIDARPVETSSLMEEAEKTFQAAAQQKKLKLLSHSVPPGVTVVADRVRVMQVIGNLIGNAIRHGHEGGTITLSAELREHDVVFKVSDDGTGIATEDLAKLFDRFFRGSRARGEGLGLGLAITRALVEAQQGSIHVTSELGKGSTFSFTLPRHKKPA